ncbi:MAG: integrase arm-type DNA-binding domain-containing protein [Desulfovibrio sp.]|nr:integrase arm-type DNA-binding domain-containing protein [Desulfovibrio sp.]
MPLTDTMLRSLKPNSIPSKHTDAGGLYLYVSSSGGKLWRMDYRFAGKRKTLSFGAYPAVSLKDARQKREEAKEQLADGIDPSAQKKEAKAAAIAEAREAAATFETVAREWYAKKMPSYTEGHRKKTLSRLEKQLFPIIGNKPFPSLEPSDILVAVRKAEERGCIETAHRLVHICGQVCRYARLVGYTKYDVSAGLSEAILPVPKIHYATITDSEQIGPLLRAIFEYNGDVSMAYALRILPYVFVRSGELRAAEWKEFNFDTAEWLIPAARMKMRRPHTVPLAKQVMATLKTLREYSGDGRLVFPSPFSKSRCISDVGLLNALRRMGYARGEMTIHGFRSMASTLLNERGNRPDVIEAQLSHSDNDKIRDSYNRAEYLPERRTMMQAWADYLDGLRDNA